jgi:prepilin-type N-terminal cleavage/methylation domain-containing protein
MRKFSNGLVAKQSGFTLIELVIVIVIIGILAAVAIPRLTGVSDEARISTNTAVLGALKSAWSGAFAAAKVPPTPTQVNQLMADPTCTLASNVFTCGTDATTTYTATLTSGAIASSADIKCTTPTLCN